MSSSERTVLSSAVSGMTAVMATKWHRPADCSVHGPQPLETRGHRQLTGTSQARRVCSLKPSEDAVGRQGPPHAGGRWRGTTELGRWGSGRRELPVCSRSADSSSASAAHEEVVSHGRTSVMSRPAERRRSTRTAADRSDVDRDQCFNALISEPLLLLREEQ